MCDGRSGDVASNASLYLLRRLTADDPRMAHEPIDAWLKPYERPDGVKQAMADYLAWETDLLPRIARDGCAKFEVMR